MAGGTAGDDMHDAGRWVGWRRVPTLRYVVVDVFTDTALAGNQLAVFTDARDIDADLMQALTREMNFSETTFLLPAEQGGTARVRIFNPSGEMRFAGHPVLGSAWVLAQPLQHGVIELETGMGIVPVELDRDESGGIAFGRMTQPVPTIEPYPEADALLEALGVGESRLPIERYDNGVLHTFVALESAEAVASLRPNMRGPGRTRGQGELLRRIGCVVEDADVRAGGRRHRRSGNGLGSRTARMSRLPSRARRVGRVDRDLAGRRDRSAVDPLRARRRWGRRDRAGLLRRPRRRCRARRVPACERRGACLSQSPDLLDDYGERFRSLRRRLEEAVLPLATSIDGRHFTCQLSPHGLDVRTGGYVVIERRRYVADRPDPRSRSGRGRRARDRVRRWE